MLAALLLFFCGCGRKEIEIFSEDDKTETSGESESRQEESETAEKAGEVWAEGSDGNGNKTGTETSSGSEDTSGVLAATPTPAQIFVDVCGAVQNPGVYGMHPGSRVFQAVEAAGGLLPEASAASVNQALPLSDGQQVYVPTTAEVEAGTAPAPGSNAAGAGTEGTAASAASGGGMAADGVVNINTADAETLKTLSGIGDAKAAAIIAYREENGGFAAIEDIMNVSGIGEGTFSKIKDKIAVK